MSSNKPITIVGGGLAGLTLGIALRQFNVPVRLCEARDYPRHRVCGEFISGRGLDILKALGLEKLFSSAGATLARTAAFFAPNARSPVRTLSSSALCLSRFKMDALLAERFCENGGELHQNTRWHEDDQSEGIVRASGRRLQPVDKGYRWFGLKVHALNVPLEADLEMYLSPGAYVGICRLNDDFVNVCGLFRKPAGTTGTQGSVSDWHELLRGQPGTPLHVRLKEAVFDQKSFCSVAGLSLRPQRARCRKECCIGDALTMIPPATGNGMSMAFESAALAVNALTSFSRGQLSWLEAQQAIARNCDAAFAQRLRFARWLQWMMFAPALQGQVGGLALKSAWLWQTMFSRTR